MLEYTPTWYPKQIEALRFLSNSSDVTQVLYGGAAGGGKSRLGCGWQIIRRLIYPGTRSVIGRADITALKETTLNTFWEITKEIGMEAGKHYVYNDNKNSIRFSNGSEILLKNLFAYPSDPNFDSFGSLEITDYFIDEAAEVTPKAVNILNSRCRFKLTEYGLKPKGLLTCNPAKGWLYNEFYLPFKSGSLPAHRAFVPALATDNPSLSPLYIENLRLLPEYDRKRLLEGDWEYDDATDGLFSTDNLNRCFRDEVIPGKRYITADIARLGNDRTVICVWEGMTVLEIVEMRRALTPEVVDQMRSLIKAYSVPLTQVLADEDGVGGGATDYVKCRGFMNGSRAQHPDRFVNLKAECYYKLAELVEKGTITFRVNSHKNVIIEELESIRRHRPLGDNKLSVTPKEELKRRMGKSPDYADAIMMRMYFELRPNYGVYAVG